MKSVHIDLLLASKQLSDNKKESLDSSCTVDRTELSLANDILSGNFINVLKNPKIAKFLGSELDKSSQIINQFLTDYKIGEILKNLIDSQVGKDEDLNYLFYLGIVSLNCFIQANYLGPALTFDPIEIYFPSIKGLIDPSKLQKSVISDLTVDGEPPYHLSSFLFLLKYALDIFSHLSTHSTDPFITSVSNWWLSRTLVVYQSTLDSLTATIINRLGVTFKSDTLLSIIKQIDGDSDLKNKIVPLKTVFYLELTRIELVVQNEQKAEKVLRFAQNSSQFKYILTGIKAKRTKFQQKETSQLIILAKSHDYKWDPEEVDDTPQTHALNSDLLLEKVHYSQISPEDLDVIPTQIEEEEYSSVKIINIARSSDEIDEELKDVDPNDQPPLKDIDTLQLLLLLYYIKQTSPLGDALVDEELMALTRRIILSPTGSVNWSVFSRALWERSILESTSPKTVERGTLQMQSLVEELTISIKTRIIPSVGKNEDEAASGPASARIRHFHQIMPLPVWTMEAKLASRFMQLGLIKSAMDLYLRLQLWGDAALCYAAVGKEHDAIELLENHLNTNPTDARALSILGDITGNPSYWEQSWECGRYPGAKRSLGKFYYSPPKNSGYEKDLKLTIKHLHDALSVNPLNYSTWFVYGCAGLELQQFELAAEAFTRCVSIDDADPKGWTNLANSLLSLGKTRESFNALQKAVRVGDKQSWRIWTNYMTVAAQLREWNETLVAARHIVEIREKSEGERAIEPQVLENLVKILLDSEYPIESKDDEDVERKLNYYQKSCIDLICNKVASLITSSSRLWRLVAKVELWRQRPWTSLECFEKGYRICINQPLLETDETIWNEAVDMCSDLVDAYENFGDREGRYPGSKVCKDWKFKQRTTLRSLIGRGKRSWEDSEGWNKLIEMKGNL